MWGAGVEATGLCAQRSFHQRSLRAYWCHAPGRMVPLLFFPHHSTSKALSGGLNSEVPPGTQDTMVKHASLCFRSSQCTFTSFLPK